MKKNILLSLLIVSTGVLSSLSTLSLTPTKKNAEPQTVNFNKTNTALNKRNLGSAD
ncbi:MAG: hypothetical protein JWR38_2171 [Mucilaginibacter sp.]|nr:hypothetical protein [Mucilaginibacter sp.]